MDRKLEIIELTNAYLRSRTRQVSTGADGVDEFVNRTLRTDVHILENTASLPAERKAALERILTAGLFEEELYSNFPRLRPE